MNQFITATLFAMTAMQQEFARFWLARGESIKSMHESLVDSTGVEERPHHIAGNFFPNEGYPRGAQWTTVRFTYVGAGVAV